MASTPATQPFGLYQAVDDAGNVYASVDTSDRSPDTQAILQIGLAGAATTLVAGIRNPLPSRGSEVRGLARSMRKAISMWPKHFWGLVRARFAAALERWS